jgi:hypothetical protein
MAKQPAEKEKDKEKQTRDKPAKPAKGGPPGDAQAKPKKAKPAADAGAEKEKAKEEKPKPPPRPPADPRLKVLKKFHGKFLPKGPLRVRQKELMERWNSGDDHGGVTVEELKSLHADWKATRARPVRTSR